MAFTYKFDNADGVYFVTTAVVEWVDVFTRSYYCDIVVNSLRYCIEKKGLVLHAWVIMPNHIHLVVSRRGNDTLSDIMRDFKKFTSTSIVKAIEEVPESRRNWMLWMFKSAGERNTNNTNFQFWQQDNHPELLYSPAFTKQKIEYLHNNPVVARLVNAPENYIYSSACDYCGTPGLLPVTILDVVKYNQ
ncbi:MAG TPA: transposase [Chitinophagales bacterium]|nr:transposase [Chitinophagales bacterium]